MKLRKLLYLLSGIFNCVIGGLGCFFGLMVFLISKTFKELLLSSKEVVEEFVQSIASVDSDMEYLLEYSHEDVVSLMMGILYVFAIILILLGVIYIVFGIFNLLLRQRHYTLFARKKSLKILFVVGSWLLMWFNIANITTTIAVFMKQKDNENEQQPLYTISENLNL